MRPAARLTAHRDGPPGRPPAGGHPLVVRVTHWVNLAAMIGMIMSGLGIYNADPILPVRFPAWSTLGGWLGGSTIWHFAVMWLLVGNGAVYLLYGVASGHLRRRLLPIRAREGLRELRLALTLRLRHEGGAYNTIQKALYLAVLLAGALMVASGLAIWKPVQFSGLTALFGGFAAARVVHFVGMAGFVAFMLVHVAMVAVVPSTLPPMIPGLGRWIARRRAAKETDHVQP